MNELMIALKVLELGLEAADAIEGLVSDAEKKSIRERIARARSEIQKPIDTSDDDTARRARLEAALRGDVPPNPFEEP